MAKLQLRSARDRLRQRRDVDRESVAADASTRPTRYSPSPARCLTLPTRRRSRVQAAAGIRDGDRIVRGAPRLSAGPAACHPRAEAEAPATSLWRARDHGDTASHQIGAETVKIVEPLLPSGRRDRRAADGDRGREPAVVLGVRHRGDREIRRRPGHVAQTSCVVSSVSSPSPPRPRRAESCRGMARRDVDRDGVARDGGSSIR